MNAIASPKDLLFFGVLVLGIVLFIWDRINSMSTPPPERPTDCADEDVPIVDPDDLIDQ